jgi:hypothetical protein
MLASAAFALSHAIPTEVGTPKIGLGVGPPITLSERHQPGHHNHRTASVDFLRRPASRRQAGDAAISKFGVQHPDKRVRRFTPRNYPPFLRRQSNLPLIFGGSVSPKAVRDKG